MKGWIKTILSKLFLKPKIFSDTEINASNCDVFDDVWVKGKEKIYQGFIYGKTRRRILVSFYDDEEDRFIDEWFITTSLQDNTKIEKNNLILYFKKPCFTD